MSKHIATFPLFGTHPLSGAWDTRKQIGTGYVYKPEQVAQRRQEVEAKGHPFRIRWRNDDCRQQYLDWQATQ